MNKKTFIIFLILLIFCSILLSLLLIYRERYENLDSNKNNDKKYTAIIVEPRKHRALEFVLKNFVDNLSTDFQFIIFHGNTNKEYVENIIDTNFKDKKTRIKLVDLKVDNLTIPEYNKLFFTKEFYDNIPTELFLVFQTDSIIITENAHKINDFMEYDYVGAPFIEMEWNKNTDKIGNGGLSLRRKSKMLQVLEKCNIEPDVPEDVYFGALFCNKVKLHKPSYEKAKEFSVEQVYFDSPFGIHKPWNVDNMSQLSKKYNDINILESLNK
jgi:hypothetical protein